MYGQNNRVLYTAEVSQAAGKMDSNGATRKSSRVPSATTKIGLIKSPRRAKKQLEVEPTTSTQAPTADPLAAVLAHISDNHEFLWKNLPFDTAPLGSAKHLGDARQFEFPGKCSPKSADRLGWRSSRYTAAKPDAKPSHEPDELLDEHDQGDRDQMNVMSGRRPPYR